MKLDCAVITAAGRDQRDLPLQSLVDRDGQSRSALAILLREVQEAGIRRVGLIGHPGAEQRYLEAAAEFQDLIEFIPQAEANGYGQALYLARDFVGSSHFLHLVGDHLYVSDTSQGCARQLVDLAKTEDCSVSAVQSTREHQLGLYGAVGGQKVTGRERLYKVEVVREKPTPTLAEQELVVPGLRVAHYLCFFGMHVLSPGIMECLERELADREQPLSLSTALNHLVQQEQVLAAELAGSRHNIGMDYGLFYAQLALGLRGVHREEFLGGIVNLLAAVPGGRG